ncbi:MAG: hypothetical protein USCAAHI_01074 [Beijerinckiaceae bacterium]|nr:MAG: hypothetical protein USCAAHI_01074 [Beijerinckiaceae bacterium]
MSEDDQGIEKTKRRGCNNEHVDRCNVGQVVVQKATPGWGGDFGPPRQVSPDRGLADLDAELEQFAVDAGGAPERVGQAHPADQITNLVLIWGRPRRRDRHRQESRKPLRCHWTTVAGLTSTMALRTCGQTR